MIKPEDTTNLRAILISLIIVLALTPWVMADKITEIVITLYKNDTIILYNLRTVEGKLSPYPKDKSPYNITITGKHNQILQSIPIYPIFILADAQNPIRDAIPMTLQVLYSANEKELQINHGKLIFSENIENYFCNNDAYCGINENYISCPIDCPSGSIDGWCDRVEDNRCDIDCLSNIDPDCVGPRNNIIIIIMAIIVLTTIAATLISRKLRKKQEPQVYYESQAP